MQSAQNAVYCTFGHAVDAIAKATAAVDNAVDALAGVG